MEDADGFASVWLADKVTGPLLVEELLEQALALVDRLLAGDRPETLETCEATNLRRLIISATLRRDLLESLPSRLESMRRAMSFSRHATSTATLDELRALIERTRVSRQVPYPVTVRSVLTMLETRLQHGASASERDLAAHLGVHAAVRRAIVALAHPTRISGMASAATRVARCAGTGVRLGASRSNLIPLWLQPRESVRSRVSPDARFESDTVPKSV